MTKAVNMILLFIVIIFQITPSSQPADCAKFSKRILYKIKTVLNKFLKAVSYYICHDNVNYDNKNQMDFRFWFRKTGKDLAP